MNEQVTNEIMAQILEAIVRAIEEETGQTVDPDSIQLEVTR